MRNRLLFVFLSALLASGNANPIYSQTETAESFAIKPGQAVYIVAVKGECAGERGMTFANGQVVVLPGPMPGIANPTAKQQKTLKRYQPLAGVSEPLKQAFTKDKTFVVVDAIAQADFVFQVCASFTEDLIPAPIMEQRQMNSQLAFAQVQVIPAALYRQRAMSPDDSLGSSMWNASTPDLRRPEEKTDPRPANDKKKKKDNPNNQPRPGQYQTWNGRPLTPELTTPRLDNLVKYFLQEYKQITPRQIPATTLAKAPAEAEPARPTFTNKPDDEPQEKRRPVLVNKQEGQEAAEKTETAPKPATETDEVIKIHTALIYVPVRVMDKDGKYIADLKPKDFKVYEDGVEQEIESFSSVDDPFNVVLLLDTSGSTRFKIEDIQDAAVTFTEQLRPQDRVMVVSFNQRVWVDCEFTNDHTKLMKAILRTRTGGGTSAYDALDLVLTERLNQIQGRKAIVLFSDGVDTTSHMATLQSTIERVEESNSIVYSVHYDTQDAVLPTGPLPPNMVVPGSTKEDYQRAEKYLLALATRSGGRFYEAATLGDAKQAFASIAEELRRQYGLGYYSKNDNRDGAFRKIRVRVEPATWAVRSREGYRAPSSKK